MYATIAQAKTYIESMYVSTSPLRVLWTSLSDEDQTILLNKAEQIIDSLPLVGTPLASPKNFPREPFADTSLLAAQKATIEVALNSLDEEATYRYTLQEQGVKSFRIGDLSETFNGGYKNAAYRKVYSIVSPILSRWLNGGFSISCNTVTL